MVEFEMWRSSPFSMFEGVGSYYNYVKDCIGLYYQKLLSDELAFKVLVFDVDHETIHSILNNMFNKETCIKFDALDNLLTLNSILTSEELSRIKKTLKC